MKKQLFIFSIFFLGSVHCAPKVPREPNLPVRSSEMPRFIRFDDTQAITFRLQNILLDEEETRILQELARNNTELVTLQETRRNNEAHTDEEIRKLREKLELQKSEFLNLYTHEIALYEEQIQNYDSFWSILNRIITPRRHQQLRTEAIEGKDKAIENRSHILSKFIKPYVPKESQFSVPLISEPERISLPKEQLQKVSLKIALEKYSKDASLRE